MSDERERLIAVYEERKRRLAGSDTYSPYNPSVIYSLQRRKQETLKLLREAGIVGLKELSLLEIGCGSGGVLLEYLGYGADPDRMHGIDLLPSRLLDAHQRLPHAGLSCADGQSLPYPSSFFDLVLQYTAFSSVLDERVRINMAREMVRVLRPSGKILWYDFWLNPTNPQTRGIRPAEIRQLFPSCQFRFERITLAPPITRKLAPVARGLCLFLESLKIFNTHYLAIIRRKN